MDPAASLSPAVRPCAALPHARDLGNAFQLTNMIRDIGEDPQPVGAAVERHSGHGLRVEILKRWSSRPAFSRFDFDEVFAIPSEYDP